MCDNVEDDLCETAFASWRRARKAYRCYACRETIRLGDRYHYIWGVWDREPAAFRHCARCWTMIERLEERALEPVDLRLDCGELYEGDDPEMLALAFATPDEMQARLRAQEERSP